MSNLILGIDTATTSVSVALSNGVKSDAGGLIGVHTISFGSSGGGSVANRAPRHAETLLPAIEFLCHQCDVGLGDLTHIVVDRGPGLFTGLRVGVATARTLAFAHDVPLVSATSLEAVASDGGRLGELVVSVLDARRSEVYAGVYLLEHDGRMTTVGEPLVGKPEVICEQIIKLLPESAVRVVGDGLLVHSTALSPLLRLPHVTTGHSRSSAAVGLVDVVLPRLDDTPQATDTEIAYLRAPDAEITWDNRHGPAPRA